MIKPEVAALFRIASNATGISELGNLWRIRGPVTLIRRVVELSDTALSAHLPKLVCDLLNLLENIK